MSRSANQERARQQRKRVLGPQTHAQRIAELERAVAALEARLAAPEGQVTYFMPSPSGHAIGESPEPPVSKGPFG